MKKKYEIRDIKILKNFTDNPGGSVLIEMGQTKVMCTAMIEDGVPFFLRGSNQGWITAEYSMLPSSTVRRKIRESTRGKVDGRTHEIQRLIGRVLRTVIDLEALGESTIWIDCDVLQADGGTRTASINGAYIALVEALDKLYRAGKFKKNPLKGQIAAVSVGILQEGPILDMCFEEDSKAIADINIVMDSKGDLIEIQGTGEEGSFSREELNEVLDFAEAGIRDIIKAQNQELEDLEIWEELL